MYSETALVVPLALAGALLLACSGLLTRLGLVHDKLYESVVWTFGGSFGLLLVLLPFTAWPPVATQAGVALFILDGLLGLLAVTLLYRGIGTVGPSISYALKSTAPLTAVVLAILFLNEQEPWPVYLGTVLAVVGVALVSVERLEGDLAFDPRVLAPLLGAVCFGAATVLRRYAMPEVSSPNVGVAVAMAASLGISFFWVRARGLSLAPGRGTPYFLAGGVLQGLALMAVYTALGLGHVAVVVPLYTSSPVFVLALSPLVLGRLERLSPRIIAGVLTVLAGVLLITISR